MKKLSKGILGGALLGLAGIIGGFGGEALTGFFNKDPEEEKAEPEEKETEETDDEEKEEVPPEDVSVED
jgi:hypothetical protein